MNALVRWGKFNVVGAMGMVVQLAALAVLNRWMRGHYLLASAAAIELTLLHNFVWHVLYTWRDRGGEGSRAGADGAVSFVEWAGVDGGESGADAAAGAGGSAAGGGWRMCWRLLAARWRIFVWGIDGRLERRTGVAFEVGLSIGPPALQHFTGRSVGLRPTLV